MFRVGNWSAAALLAVGVIAFSLELRAFFAGSAAPGLPVERRQPSASSQWAAPERWVIFGPRTPERLERPNLAAIALADAGVETRFAAFQLAPGQPSFDDRFTAAFVVYEQEDEDMAPEPGADEPPPEPGVDAPAAEPERPPKAHAPRSVKKPARVADVPADSARVADAPADSAPTPEADPSRTAIYDIAARVVYLPDGERLEAHSGLGSSMDDPRYVNLRMRGPTPPNVYRLTLRERLFHGVRAIRLVPVDEGKMYGRAGILAHPYMLGGNGQSNGCVSFRDYPKFLEAFLRGQVDHLVVVDHLESAPTAKAGPGWFWKLFSSS